MNVSEPTAVPVDPPIDPLLQPIGDEASLRVVVATLKQEKVSVLEKVQRIDKDIEYLEGMIQRRFQDRQRI